MTEKVELKVNSKNLSSVISLLKKKYNIIGGSWTGKSEPIALKLAKFCVRVDDNLKQKSDIISLLNEYEDDELNRKHAFIGISATDLLVLLFNEEMKLSINNNCLTTKYYEKTLNTTRNLHGLLLEDILLNSQDKLHVEVNMTIDIKPDSSAVVEQTSSNADNQESDSIAVIEQTDSNSNKKESDSITVIEQTSSNGDKKESDSIAVVEQTGSNGDNQQDNSKNVIIGHIIINGIIISIVAASIVWPTI
jgi:hypothetical protein